MEGGFIRAEVVAYDDFERCGTMLEARKQEDSCVKKARTTSFQTEIGRISSSPSDRSNGCDCQEARTQNLKVKIMARTLFIVRLVLPFPGLEGYDAMLSNYWSAVKAQLERHAISSGPDKAGVYRNSYRAW